MPMTKTFTQDELIRYIYKETPEHQTKEIKNALICDSELLDEYKKLATTIKQLDKVKKSPSDDVINKILDFSKNYKTNSVKS